jgi:hypothetical protein
MNGLRSVRDGSRLAVHASPPRDGDPEQMVNYVTPGYATAVFVSAGGVQRV